VGARSWFVYDVDPAPHRGSRRRPDRQAKEPETVSTPYVSSIRRTVAGLLELLPTDEPLHLIADGRVDYRFAFRRKELGGRIVLHAFPNPKRGPKGSPRTAEAAARDAAMFPVDALHQFVRHTCADHKRETIAFGRRLESIIGRLQLMAVWKNFIKGRSERASFGAGRPGSPSSAVRTPSSAASSSSLRRISLSPPIPRRRSQQPCGHRGAPSAESAPIPGRVTWPRRRRAPSCARRPSRCRRRRASCPA